MAARDERKGCGFMTMGGMMKLVIAGILLGAVAGLAQEKSPGVSAGGKWMEFHAEDKMTAAQRVRFELPADNEGDDDRSARVILYCTNGKLELADFRPNSKMAGPNNATWWSGKPQMSVRVRVDQSHRNHNWNWVNGHFLAMDKDTAREMIGSRIFKIEFQTPQGSQIAEFSPLGLNLDRVKQACHLKPEKPD
jgi:hypothetical protein